METIMKAKEYERKLKSSIYYFSKEERKSIYGLYVYYRQLNPISFEMFVETCPWDFMENNGVKTYFLY